MLIAQQRTMQNRTKINRLFNGDTPNTEEEARAENMKTNANWLEGPRIASNATNQINNSFFKGDKFFSVRIDNGPIQFRQLWSNTITNYINRELKRSKQYYSARESANAQVVLHGPGPSVWQNRRCPVPSVVGVEDVLVPSATLTSFSNLDRFAIYREISWPELYSSVHGPNFDSGWNRDYAAAFLARMYKTGVVPVYQGNRWLFPEKLWEDIKEGSATVASSSLPKLLTWDFFYQDDKTGKVNRRMIVDYQNITSIGLKDTPVDKNRGFLYSRDNYAADWSEVIHWFIGNCSNVAPYRYYSIRSIGYLLFAVCTIQNKLRNRLYDHMFQALLTLFRNISDDDREKLGLIDLQNFGIMPDGVSMVPAQERHVVDQNLILMGLNQGRQLMQESSTGFLPDMPSAGEGPAMTAYETMVRQMMSTTFTSAVMGQLVRQSVEQHREICRRFCIKDNPDPMTKRFRENIQKEGVPLEMLDVDTWEIIPEQTVGGGSKAVELTVTQQLLQEIAPAVGPEAQRAIYRRRALALTDNVMDAAAMVPEPPAPPTDDVQYAQTAFTFLMINPQFEVKEGINRTVYVTTLLKLADFTFQQLQGLLQHPEGLAIAAERIMGLANIAEHCEPIIVQIAQDQTQKAAAKQLVKVLMKLQQELQQAAKQIEAAEQEKSQQGGIDPQTEAKIQERLLMAHTDAQIKHDAAAEKQKQKDIAFYNENLRRNASTFAEVQRGHAKTQAEIAGTDLTTQAEILRGQRNPQPSE